MGFVVLYIESSAFVFQVVYPACECPPRIPYARFGMGADLLIYHGYVSRPAPPRSLYAFVRRRISPSDHSPPGVPAVHLIEFVDHLLAGCKSSYIPAEKVLTSSLETLIGLRYSPPRDVGPAPWGRVGCVPSALLYGLDDISYKFLLGGCVVVALFRSPCRS